MRSPNLDTLRLFVHLLAATVWVGGQLTLAGLLPGLRALGPDAPRSVARRFNAIAWPAFAVLVVTGVWHMVAFDVDLTTDYGVTVAVKIGVVALSGISAAAHAGARSRSGLAAWGAISGLTALGALFLGALLHRGS